MEIIKNRFCFGVKSKLFAAVFDVFHVIIRCIFSKRFKQVKLKEIRHVLLCNWASLGDVLLATSVIPVIRAHFPNCKIGFLVSKNSRVVLDTCPGIDWIHETNRWARTNTTVIQQVCSYIHNVFGEQRKLAREISKKKYDCSIELLPFFPNTIPIMWKAKIPLRIGFNTSGNSNLLNASVQWPGDQYLPQNYWELLDRLGIKKNAESLRPIIEVPEKSNAAINERKSPVHGLPRDYLIFHLFSSYSAKELPMSFWKELRELCIQNAILVYFTGQGKRERQIIEEMIGLSKYNLCDQLTWQDLVKVIKASKGVISVDSVPVHLAAALNVPFAALYKSTPHPKVWQPITENGTIFDFNASIEAEKVFNLVKQWVVREILTTGS